MKRIQDKIKDLVEPQAFEQVGNFAEDPARALTAYRFTDLTSDLLSRWLDALAERQRGGGAALALAGARGVGKSHTLAVFGALAGSERLRSTVEDNHVATSAQRLTGRRCAVVRVERGTRPTLAGEMAVGLARVFGGGEGQWMGAPAEMLSVAASRAAGETLVVVVDTAFNRPARVRRDDGPALGGLAVAARSSNSFVALALDDDIAGADGPNAVLAGAYQIEYLDPENLFRVAEQFVLRKKPQVRGTIGEIYNALRASVPNFNWSEARFASVYPVHPLVAEVAAGVRLYVPGFAFLPFAAGVAARAASRPALSLVLLDEVFDATEEGLRKSAELKAAFESYDLLTANCVNQMPVMLRHQARLVLKSLFALSLDGRGATAGELCAALLLTDELAEAGATRQIADVLARFADGADGGALSFSTDADGQTRYRFRTPARDEPEAAAAHEHASAAKDGAGPADPAPARVDAAETTGGVEATAKDSALPECAATGDGGGAAACEGVTSEDRAAPEGGAGLETGGGIWADLAADESLWDEDPRHVAADDGASGKDFVTSLIKEVAAELGIDDIAPRSVVDVGGAVPEHLDAQAAAQGADDLTEWARRLTGCDTLPSIETAAGLEAARAELAAWLEEWRTLRLGERFAALPSVRLTTHAGRYEADMARSFGRAARAAEEALTGRVPLRDCLERVAAAFHNSPEVFASRVRQLEDFRAFLDGFDRRERLRAYLAHSEATGVAQIETARRELLSVAEDPNSLLDAEQRRRFEHLWREFHARYTEHYASAHDAARAGARWRATAVRRGPVWRDFEQLARLPLMSSRVRRQAESLMRMAEWTRCDLSVRELLAERPSCACRFRLAGAGSGAPAPEEIEAHLRRALDVYRKTLLLYCSHLAIGLDALARKEADEGAARRARALSSAFAQSSLPERFTRAEVRLIERALRRSPPPPVRVAAPDGDSGLLTREELRERMESWLEELPEHPARVEVLWQGGMSAT